MSDDDTSDAVPRPSTTELRGPRMSTVGIPTEKSKDFGATSKRLFDGMGPERRKIYLVLLLAVTSVTLVVAGPRVLGHATDIIFDGVMGKASGGGGIDFGELHRTLMFAIGLFVSSYVLSYLQAFILAGAVQRTMMRMRSDV
jgi:ATP-binding cassette subfamily B protein